MTELIETNFVLYGGLWCRAETFKLSRRGTCVQYTPCRLDINRLAISCGITPQPQVDWLYRSIMWMYQHLGLRRLLIWYRNMED